MLNAQPSAVGRAASGGVIDPALLQSGLKLLQRGSYFIVCGDDAALLPQADASRVFSSTMMLTSALER